MLHCDHWTAVFMVIACIIFTTLLSTSALENAKWQAHAQGRILMGWYVNSFSNTEAVITSLITAW